MKLITDTNILVRCSRGRSWLRAIELRVAGVDLVTTDRNVEELVGVLQRVFGMNEQAALIETARVLQPFEIVDESDYAHLRGASAMRLREGGQSDWPVLAAAMALDSGIWSEDLDFFGVGVPVWSTPNVMIAGSHERG